MKVQWTAEGRLEEKRMDQGRIERRNYERMKEGWMKKCDILELGWKEQI